MIDDEANVERFGLVGALPGLAEQAGLIRGRERGRFAHVDVRRAQTDDRADDRVDDVAGRDDQQAHGTADALGERDDVGEQSPLVRRRRALAGVFLADVDVEQSRRHDHDVAIAWRLKRRDDVRERGADCGPARARCPDGPRSDRARARRRAAGRTCLSSALISTGAACRRPRVNHSAKTVMSAAGGDGGDVAGQRSSPARSRRRSAAGANRPTGSSRPLERTLPRALNGVGAGRVRRRRASAAIVSTSMTAMRDRVRARQPGDAAAAGEHHEDRRGDRDVDGTSGSAEPRVQRGEPGGQRAVGGGAVEHLLGVAERGVRGREQHAAPRHRQGERHQHPAAAAGAARCCARPTSGAFSQSGCSLSRHEQDDEERRRVRSPRREERRQQTGAPERLHARRRQLVRRARQGLAATDDRQRQREAQHESERRIDSGQPVSDGIGGAAPSAATATRRRAASVITPQTIASTRIADADPDASRHRIAADVAADARREPQQPDRANRDQRREILGPDVAGEAPSGDRRRRHAGQVVADDDAGERAEEHALDQRRRLGDTRGARTEGARSRG